MMSLQGNYGSQSNPLEEVLQIVNKMARLSANGDYIYRGEPKCHPKVSSNLYRDYEDTDLTGSNIADIQEAILNEAETYTNQINRREILAELQHYGGKINLIDFTTDYLVALFFACDGDTEEDGRVIFLLKSEDREYEVWRPQIPGNRVSAQKSIFVQPQNGFVEPDDVVIIPKNIKISISNYLRNSHDITTETIYNDIHGFIRYRNIYQNASIEFRKGVACQSNGDLEGAIEHYTKALAINPRTFEAYYRRGLCHMENGNFESSVQDFGRTLELDPENPDAHQSLGEAHRQLGAFDVSIEDFSRAIALDPENAELQNHLGITYMELGEFERGVQNFTVARDLDPNNAAFYSNLGEAYKQLGATDLSDLNLKKAAELDSIQSLTEAIELDPNDPRSYSSRGIAHIKANSFDAAIEDFTKAIELEPAQKIYYCNRGETWVHLCAWDRARADLAIAKAMGMDIVASFRNDYEDVADLERRNEITLPDDIAITLGGELSKQPTLYEDTTGGPVD